MLAPGTRTCRYSVVRYSTVQYNVVQYSAVCVVLATEGVVCEQQLQFNVAATWSSAGVVMFEENPCCKHADVSWYGMAFIRPRVCWQSWHAAQAKDHAMTLVFVNLICGQAIFSYLLPVLVPVCVPVRSRAAILLWFCCAQVLPAHVPSPLEAFSWEDMQQVEWQPGQAAIYEANWLVTDAYNRAAGGGPDMSQAAAVEAALKVGEDV